MKIEIKHRYSGEVLFEHDCDNNTIRITLQVAIAANANLSNADLSNANLRNAKLWNADLRNADLSNADLSNADLWNAKLWNADLRNAKLWNADLRNADLIDADLSNADLSNADLSDANLSNAKLWNADLWNAKLWNAVGNGIHVISAQVLQYRICYTAEFMWIGCRKHPIKTWWKDSEKDADRFSDSDKEWRAKNKRWIQAMVKNNPAIPTGKESVK